MGAFKRFETEAEEIQWAITWMYNHLNLPTEEQIKAEEEYFTATSGYSGEN